MSIKDDLERVPSWVWLGGAAAGGVLLFLHGRSSASGSGAASVPLTSGNGQIQGVQSGLNPDGTLPSQDNSGTPTPTPATPPPRITFAQALATVLPSVYSQSGFSNNPNDSAQGSQDLYNTLGQFGSDNAQYQDWLAQVRAASASGQVGQLHQLFIQGEQFGSVFGNQTVTAQGWLAGTAAVAQNAQQQQMQGQLNMSNTGGGGYAYHPASTQSGGMNDAFGLQGPNNPSIHG